MRSTPCCACPTNPLAKRVPDTGDLCSFILAAPFYTARRARAYQSSTCSSSASAIRAAPLAAELPSMLRRSDLLGEQHAGALHGARPGAHRLRASCAKVTPAARRHRDMRRERRVASVRTLALIRVASLVARDASKHSLESSGARRRKGPVHKYQRTLYACTLEPSRERFRSRSFWWCDTPKPSKVGGGRP